MSELRVVLMHLVDLAWFDVELWESEVTLLKNVFLVKFSARFLMYGTGRLL